MKTLPGKVWYEDDIIKVESLPKERLEDIIKLYHDSFYIDEPINQAIISEIGFEKFATDHDKVTKAETEAFPALGTIEKTTNELTSALTLGIQSRSHSLAHKKPYVLQNAKMKKLFQFLEDLTENVDLFNRYNVDILMYYLCVGVDKKHREKGLCSKLFQCALEITKVLGISVIAGVYTSPYSIRAAEKLGKEIVYQIDLQTYKENGQVVFNVQKPNNVICVMARKI